MKIRYVLLTLLVSILLWTWLAFAYGVGYAMGALSCEVPEGERMRLSGAKS